MLQEVIILDRTVQKWGTDARWGVWLERLVESWGLEPWGHEGPHGRGLGNVTQ